MLKKSMILVTGATGKQGGAVVRSLLAKGHGIRAMTRHPESEQAKELERLGVEIVEGQFDDENALNGAMDGVQGFFLMGTSMEGGPEQEIRDGLTAVKLAERKRIPHLVYTSVADADKKTGIPHFDSKFMVEEYLRNSNLNFTIIAPAYFYENFLSPMSLPGLRNGVFTQALPANISLQSISVRTIGDFAAHIFDNRGRFSGMRINIAADSKTGPEFAKSISQASGKNIRYIEIPIDQVRAMSKDYAVMYEWFAAKGYDIDIPALRKSYPLVNWFSFDDWAGAQNWNVLEGQEKAAS